MLPLNVKYLPYKKIALEAQNFLTKYNPNNDIPVPIEDIIEFQLKLDIIPTDNLLKNFDVDGFTTSDFSCIYVDDYIYNFRPTRFRFTLAHEIGHLILHKDLFKSVNIDSTTNWKSFINEVDPTDYSELEYQGYDFGGLILVPPQDLNILFKENIHEISPLINKARDQGLERNDYLGHTKNKIAKIIAPHFDVSAQVIIKRIELDKLDDLIP